MTHVPFNGPAAARNALLAGDIQVAFELATSLLPHLSSGRLRALAVTGRTRSPQVPDLPTMAEAGIPDFEVTTWVSVVGPAGLPATIVDTLNRQIGLVLAQPETLKKLDDMGTTAAPSTPAELRARMEHDSEKWGRVIRESGAKLD
jgi:tripartite-type tricarboxylate transporter receptor subunit TctC